MTTTVKLALEDGTVLCGRHFGAVGEIDGEVVFNTSMTGYQEILTDPSYTGQIVTMTYPQIGNYGVNPEDVESARVAVRGFIVKELCRRPSSYRSTESLDQFLARAGVVGIEGIDTRALVRKLRIRGVLNGVLSSTDLDDTSLIHKARACQGLLGRDLIREVMPESTHGWNEGLFKLSTLLPVASSGPSKHVVALDYGMKWNIPRYLTQLGCRVTVMRGDSTASEVLAQNPDGVFLSNGPGDPKPLTYAIETIRGVLGKKPIFGICLGHQLLGLALGGETYKLKFGHRGANQPVLNTKSNRVEITSQNHGFAILPESLPGDVEVTHWNLNDNTVEGLQHKTLPAFAVQYHPEASAGPHDSHYLFHQFLTMMA